MDVLLFVNSKSFATMDDNIFTFESKCCIGNQNIESDTVFDTGDSLLATRSSSWCRTKVCGSTCVTGAMHKTGKVR